MCTFEKKRLLTVESLATLEIVIQIAVGSKKRKTIRRLSKQK
jgi:hypothetical protein